MRKLFYFALLILGVIILFSAKRVNALTCNDVGGICEHPSDCTDGYECYQSQLDCTVYPATCCCVVSTTQCSNGNIDPGEQCDGNDLGGKTCQDFGFTGGTLSCNSNCTFNTSGCTGGGGGEGIIEIKNPLKAEEFEVIVDNIINFIFKIAIVLAPLMLVIAGALFVTAGGNEKQINQAKNIILWTAVGFFILLLAKGILVMIESILGIE